MIPKGDLKWIFDIVLYLCLKERVYPSQIQYLINFSLLFVLLFILAKQIFESHILTILNTSFFHYIFIASKRFIATPILPGFLLETLPSLRSTRCNNR
mgnify:CR=1 FL=1